MEHQYPPNRRYNLLVDCSFILAGVPYIESLYVYVGRLLRGLRYCEAFKLYALVARGAEEYVENIVQFKVDKISVDINSSVFFSKKIDRLFGVVPFEEELKKREIDIVLSPYSIGYMYVYPHRYHQHAIIHDLIPIINKSVSSFYLFIYKRILRTMPHLITISESTRKDVQAFIHRDSTVLYNSVFYDFSQKETPIKEIEDVKYILDVNRFVRYKNAETLVRAMNLLKNKIPHYLYLKGLKLDVAYFDYLKTVIHELGLSERVILDTENRSDEEMRYLYKNASLFVTPSLKEGFGYTPIEAAIMKVPVLISDIDSLKEVTKGRIQTFNPHSFADLAAKIEEIIISPPSEEERSQLSVYYKKEYSSQTQIKNLTDILLKHLENN